MSDSKKSFTYKDAGVDIESGEHLVKSISNMVKETHNDQVINKYGLFGGFFRLDLKEYSKPVMVSSVDGVGTKLIVAFKSETYDSVGQDLVNHCVNDIAVGGANPLFFMDYFSTGKLEAEVGKQVVKGFSKACKENEVALLGGETAEMPDIYQSGEFDLAGTIVGIVDEDNIIDGNDIKKGDKLIGFESNGLHTNGYSLARKILFKKYNVGDYIDELGCALGEELLRVHTSYLELIKRIRDKSGVHGLAHITGGGLLGNLKRILPEKVTAHIYWKSWDRLPVFKLIQELGNVPEEDMRQTFNLGIGIVAVVDEQKEEEIKKVASDLDLRTWSIGHIE